MDKIISFGKNSAGNTTSSPKRNTSTVDTIKYNNLTQEDTKKIYSNNDIQALQRKQNPQLRRTGQ